MVILDTDHLWGCGGDYAWVWKAFLQGTNPVFMDPWEGLSHADTVEIDWLSPCLYPKNHVPYQLIRKNLGVTRQFSLKINLEKNVPMPELTSSGYCLAHPNESYLVWVEAGKYLTLNLRGAPGEYSVEWFNPQTLQTQSAAVINGDDYVVFKAPFTDDAVLYLKRNINK
ncbi:MAG: hypothetical protein WAN36_04950 [Calditrichia bacterium]